jgi:hypothetical protein
MWSKNCEGLVDMNWTPENIQWYFQQPPPRLPEGTLLDDALDVIFPRIVRVIFYILPVLMLIITSVMLTFLIRTADLKSEWRLMTEPAIQTRGKVLEMEQSKSSKGSVTYIYTYEFKPVGREGPNDAPVKGVSYAGNRVASPGETVLVDYLPDAHPVSRIKGCRVNFVSVQGIVVIPFIGIITAILPWGVISYKKKFLRRLITLGVTASAMIEKIKPGGKGTLAIGLRYTVGGTEVQSRTSTGGGKGVKEWLMSLHQSGQTVLILADPEKPKRIFMLELLLKAKGAHLTDSIS